MSGTPPLGRNANAERCLKPAAHHVPGAASSPNVISPAEHGDIGACVKCVVQEEKQDRIASKYEDGERAALQPNTSSTDARSTNENPPKIAPGGPTSSAPMRHRYIRGKPHCRDDIVCLPKDHVISMMKTSSIDDPSDFSSGMQ